MKNNFVLATQATLNFGDWFFGHIWKPETKIYVYGNRKFKYRNIFHQMYLQNKRVENQFFRTTVPNVSNRMRFKKIIFFVENQTLSIVISFVSNCIYCGKIKTLVVNIKSIVFAVVKYTLWPWEISFDK